MTTRTWTSCRRRKDDQQRGMTVFSGGDRREESVFLHSVVAVGMLLGLIHFNVALLFLSFAVLPLRLALLVFGLQLCLIVVPLDHSSKWGHKFSRYICKYSGAYFPITLHVEDIEAFDSSQAYVFGFEPHSVFPIGIVALSNFTGFMPLPKVKVLVSSTVFHTPLLRQIWTWLGLIPATKRIYVLIWMLVTVVS